MKFRKVGRCRSRCSTCHKETWHEMYVGGGRIGALWWVCEVCQFETVNERYHFDKGWGGPISGVTKRS